MTRVFGNWDSAKWGITDDVACVHATDDNGMRHLRQINLQGAQRRENKMSDVCGCREDGCGGDDQRRLRHLLLKQVVLYNDTII